MFGSKPAFGTPSFGTTATSFGSSTFGSQPQSSSLFGTAKPTVSFGQPTQTTGGFFGTAATTTSSNTFGGGGTSLFGNPSTSQTFGTAPSTSMFNQQRSSSFFGGGGGTSAFGFQPGTTGGFGTSGSLFGSSSTQQQQQQQPASTGLFGNQLSGQTSNLFGSTAQTNGTTIKFDPLIATDQMLKNSNQVSVQTRHQCISAMKQYENKSLEELRAEDYLANRKGPQTISGMTFGQPQTSVGLFAPVATTSSVPLFGAATTSTTGFGGSTFGASTGTFGSTSFGSQPQQTSLFGSQPKPVVSFGQPTSQTIGGGIFGTTATTASNTFGGTSTFPFANTSTAGTFGGAGTSGTFGQPAAQSVFGARAPATFPTSIQSSTGFGSFGNTTGSIFSTTSAQQPAASTGIFGNTLSTLPTNQTQQQKGFGTTFGQPTAFNPNASFGSGLFTGNTSGFGTTNFLTQPKQPTFNTLPFGSNTSAFSGTMAPSAPAQNVTLGTDHATYVAQQALLQSQLLGLAQSPYGDGALLKLLKGKRDTTLPSPTNPAAYQQVLNTMNSSSNSTVSSSFVAKPLPPARPSPRILTTANSSSLNLSTDKKSLFDDVESDTFVFKEGFVPKRNVKKLVLNRSASKTDKRTSTLVDNTQRSLPGDIVPVLPEKRSSLPLMDNVTKPLNFDAASANNSEIINSVVAIDNDDDDDVDNHEFSSTERECYRRRSGERIINETFATGVVPPRAESLTRRPISQEGKTYTLDVSQADYTHEQTSPANGVSKRGFTLKSTHTERNVETVEENREDYHGETRTVNKPVKQLVDSYTSPVDEDLSQSANGFYVHHPAKIICQREDYYTVPPLDALSEVLDEDGRCIVDGFTVGRTDYGSVFWPETINVANLNLDNLVHFRHKEVTVYPDDTVKPPVGCDLNRRAEVTLERVWPNDKTTHQPIKDPKRLEMMRYRERLERACSQMNAKFLAYRPETGSWVFQVPHFSKYGIADDTDEDAAVGVVRIDRKIFRRTTIVSPPPSVVIPSASAGVVAGAGAVRTVAQISQPKNNLKLFPYENSLLCGRCRCFVDSACINNRRFRVGWFPQMKFVGRNVFDYKTDGSRISVFRTINRTETVSRDFTVIVQQAENERAISLDLIDVLLKTQFEFSNRRERSGRCPCFAPLSEIDLTSVYLNALASTDVSVQEKTFFEQVFRLCQALWAPLRADCKSSYEVDFARSRNLTEWLTEVSKECVDAEVKLSKNKGKENTVEGVLSFLTGRRLEEAAQFAFDNGDIRLAILLTQLGGNEQSRTLFRQQLSQWCDSKADQHINPTRIKIFALLGGLLRWDSSTRQTINACENLDWLRCFGLNFWYCCRSCTTIVGALKEYDSTWTNENCEDNFSSPPVPVYFNRNEKMDENFPWRTKQDIRYHLLKLFTNPAYRLETVLNSETWTSDPLSCHLSWHVWCILNSLGYKNIAEHRLNQLHIGYAAQLEQCDRWLWSIFVLMHITNDDCRERHVKRLLSLYVPSSDERQEKFIVDELHVPVAWLYEVKALAAHQDLNSREIDRRKNAEWDEATFQLKSEHWNLAHIFFLKHNGPLSVVNGDKASLESFLNALVGHVDDIQNWSRGGQIFYDFSLLTMKYDALKEAENLSAESIYTLKPLVLSLANRLKLLECSTPLQRLCQSEMTFRIAQLIRLVLNDEKYLESVEIVAALPMPDDDMMEEMQRFVDLAIQYFDKTVIRQ